MMHVLITLLVVDPSADVRTFLHRSLTRMYPEIIVMDNGTVEGAIHLLHSGVITCVLTTYDLPDGTAGAIMAAAQCHHPPIPVIGMSSYTDHGSELLSAGAFAFLLKPFTFDQLVAVLEQAVPSFQRERRR